jgi:hypothetical protein
MINNRTLVVLIEDSDPGLGNTSPAFSVAVIWRVLCHDRSLKFIVHPTVISPICSIGDGRARNELGKLVFQA